MGREALSVGSRAKGSGEGTRAKIDFRRVKETAISFEYHFRPPDFHVLLYIIMDWVESIQATPGGFEP